MALPNAPRKTIVLTGASRGIGHATVKRFSSAGWRVITCSRQAFPEDCPWEAGPEDHLQIDLGDAETLDERIAHLRDMLDGAPLEALVNNAGISIKGSEGERLDTLTTEMDDWRHVFRVNFFAPIALARGLIEELKAAQGAIVNVTSLTREMAADFGRYGIRVNSIAPGEIQTGILSPGTEEALLPEIPMGRLGAPEEVAKTIYFLCSEQSSYVNGAEIHINGGQHV